jgi:flagellar hook-basal body complex protein FliE
MNVSPISRSVGVTAPSQLAPSQLAANQPGQAATTTDFGTRIESAIDALVDAQKTARTSAAQWESGLRTDLAAVMIDQQVASLGFQLALNVRNKAIGAYRDIMNMSI